MWILQEKIVEMPFFKKKSVSSFWLVFLILCILLSNCSKKSRPNVGETTPMEETRIPITDPLSPEEQRKGFKLPPGFEVEVFAAEPDIGKPMNMAFDEQGRLWVTQTREYPFPAEEGQGRDQITILEDTDRDGQADVFTVFADSLNIPIGILPVEEGAVAFSIPSVYYFKDTDGEGRANQQQFLYGEFEYIDTHGMVNSFARGFDGWIYAGHGYRNHSTARGETTESITMESGHTFRFQRDGSAIEVVTTGRVNPFALTFDQWGYQYSSDSHSDPIYQLIPGGDYPHFGKTPTGIGYGPHMMDHEHGPTAITGVAINDMNQFPPEYKNSLFNGNVLTNKIFRDSLAWHGATPEAIHKGEFLTSEDRWFRPVDMTMGPDGALYIADFYNRIIGHYEVPLDHPGRDRQRGRIWRITYNGKSADGTDWSEAGLNGLLDGLNDSHLKTRLRIADRIVSEFGQQAVAPLTDIVEATDTPPIQKAHGLWILDRLDALSNEMLAEAARTDAAIVRVHAMRILGERSDINKRQQSLLVSALDDGSAHVRRTAVQALARHVRTTSFQPVLNLYKEIPEYDTFLRHATSLTLRDHLRNPEIMQLVRTTTWDGQSMGILADHMVGVPSEEAAVFLISYIGNHPIPETKIADYTDHAVRYLPRTKQDELMSLLRKKFGDNLSLQRPLFEIIQSEMDRRGEPPGASFREWGLELAEVYLDDIPTSKSMVWSHSLLSDSSIVENPWVTESMTTEDAGTITVLSSRPKGEGARGVLTSPVFTLHEEIGFYLYVRDSDIATTSGGTKVRLRLTETDEVIKEITGDQEQLERQVTWEVSDYSGLQAYLEVVDAASDGHMAVGDFSLPKLEVPAVSPSERADRLQFAAELAGTLGAAGFTPALEKVMGTRWLDVGARASAANVLVGLAPSQYISVVRELVTDESEPLVFRNMLIEHLGQQTAPETHALLADVLPEVSGTLQLEISRSLVSTPAGAELLLETARKGELPKEVLKDPSIASQFENLESQTIQRDYQELTKGLESRDDKQRLIEQRLAEFDPEDASLTRGKQIFQATCSMCHQLNQGNGENIGPQLDGIGSRGAAFIAESILAPNRTVAESWRINTITLRSGEVQTGLFRREEGDLLIFANFQGTEFSIPKDQIEERTESPATIMPPNYRDVLSPEEFYDLLAFLLSQK